MNLFKKSLATLMLLSITTSSQCVRLNTITKIAGVITAGYLIYNTYNYVQNCFHESYESNSDIKKIDIIEINDIIVTESENTYYNSKDYYPSNQITTTLTFTSRNNTYLGTTKYFCRDEHIKEIDLLLIKIDQKYRNKGLGKIFFKRTEAHIKEKYPKATHLIGEAFCIEPMPGITKEQTTEKLKKWYGRMGFTILENGIISYEIKK